MRRRLPVSARAKCHPNVESFIQSQEIELRMSFQSFFAMLRHGSPHTSRGTTGEHKIFVPSSADFCPIAGCEDRLVQSSQTNFSARKDIRLLVGASRAAVEFRMIFEGEF